MSGLRIAQKLKRERNQPCAIIGAACRLPGAADLAQLHALLRAGREAICDAPAERWDLDAFYSPERGAPGRMITRRGGFLPELDRFASDFFEISPREAAMMDPQQRLLLEVAWEAFEAAGLTAARLANSRTGVYVGISALDTPALRSGEAPNGFSSTGTALSVAAGRISYVFDLHGPTLALDTACSSSLVALHHACVSLQRGETDAALAAGVNVMLDPRVSVTLSHSGMLSAEGRCKTFDQAADGYVRSEGCAAVVVKRLRDAERDGDRILAVIRGTAVNHDGRTQGLTAPSGVAQRAVIRQALDEAGVEPADVQVLEAHGTGTPLGDPQELDAIADVFAGRDRRLLVGSVKTNLGHLEAAAGMAGVLRIVLGLVHREVFPHLHLQQANRELALSELPIAIPTELQPWRPNRGGQPRIGAVSSFGFSGTNAHVVLEQAPRPAAVTASTEARAALPLALSARSETELCALAGRYAAHLRSSPAQGLADLCFTAATRRDAWSHRCIAPARDRDNLIECLDQIAGGGSPADARLGRVHGGQPPKIAFLFTGQGSQYAGLARGLYDTFPVFRAALDRCAELFRPELPIPLLDAMFAATGPLDQTLYTQSAVFSLGWSLAELWRACGVEPAAVVGHSIGEITAACVAGALELDEAARFVAARGRLMQDAMAEGAMLAIVSPAEPIEALVARRPAELSIAAYNAPSLVVVAGAVAALAELERELAGQQIRARRLVTSRAFHSPLVDPIAGQLERAAAALHPRAPRCRLASNVTGAWFAEAPDAAYWARHARAPVRFGDNLRAALDHGCTVLVELGPDPVLLGLAGAIAGAGVASLRRGADDAATFIDAAAALYLHGAPIDWAALDVRASRKTVALPSYAFARRRFALARRVRPARTPAGSEPLASTPEPAELPAHHGLALRPVPGDLSVGLYELVLADDTLGALADHRIRGATVMPGAGLVELVLAAARAAFDARRVRLEELAFVRPLICVPDQRRRLHVAVMPFGRDRAAVRVTSQPASGGAWTPHAEGRLVFSRHAATVIDGNALELLQAFLSEEAPVEPFYTRVAGAGLELGPRFRGVVQAFPGHPGSGEALGRIEVPAAARPDDRTWLHPVLLDSAFQLVAFAIGALDTTGSPEPTRIPASIAQLDVTSPIPSHAWAHARARRDGDDVVVDLDLWGDQGERLAEARELRLIPLPVTLAGASEDREAAARADQPALPEDPDLPQQLRDAEPAARRELMLGFLRRQVASVIGLDDPAELDLRRTLYEIGMTSVMAIELQYRIQSGLGFKLPARASLDFESAESLADYLITFALATPPESTAGRDPARSTV